LDSEIQAETLYFALFSSVFGVTYAFRLDLISSYGWHFGSSFNPPNYAVAGILMYALPVGAALLFLVSFKRMRGLFEGRRLRYFFVAYVLLFSFSPFFLYHGIQYIAIDTRGLSESARGCGSNICAGTPAGAAADFLETLGWVFMIGALVLLVVLGRLVQRGKMRKLAAIATILLVLGGMVGVAYVSEADGAFIPRYGVHLDGIQVDPYLASNGTSDSSIGLPAQGRAGALLMEGGEFLEVLQVVDNGNSPVKILSLSLESGESKGFTIIHSSVDSAAASGGYEIYPGVIAYIYIYMQAPNFNISNAGFRLQMYET